MSRSIILAIKYAEPEWQHTLTHLSRHSCPVIFIDREGSGSLAEAINRGFNEIRSTSAENVWIVTNCLFPTDTLAKLERSMEKYGCDAVHPCFKSDHKHLQPSPTGHPFTSHVPFLEFTAPLIRKKLLEDFKLDEDMPYWGHDLDWGYRVTQAGFVLGVDYTRELQHTYIRNNKQQHPMTLIRRKKRIATNESTEKKLIEKYGADWRITLKYPG